MLDTIFNYAAPHATGEKAKARDIISAIRTLKNLDGPANGEQRERLKRFPGFGCVALSIFPDPTTGTYKDGWREVGQELQHLLTEQEYSSAKRTTFNAFYTSPLVMKAAFAGLSRMGLPDTAHVLEPGCGNAGFMSAAPEGMRFTGIEMDNISGKMAQAIHPSHDIRIENFRDTRPPAVDAVTGNVPFGDISLPYGPYKFSLHDFFFAKSVDALSPGGLVALVTSRFTLDKITGKAREYLAETADFVGAIRLPDDAFKDQGTKVVTDIIFLRKRHVGEPANHAGDWLNIARLPHDSGETPINAYFIERPDMVMGEFSVGHGMYGQDTLSVRAPVDFEQRLSAAVASLPVNIFSAVTAPAKHVVPSGLEEGAFLIVGTEVLQVEAGEVVPVKYGERVLRTDEGMMGARIAALVELRDLARHVLKTQNEGHPIPARDIARRDLNQSYTRFVKAYGPINKTTFSRNAQGNEVRRVPNITRFREDPNAFLVMSLEVYDESTGKAERAPIMLQDVVGPIKPVESVETAEQGLAVSLNELGRVDIDHIRKLYGQDPVAELGDLIYDDNGWVTRDAFLSGNVRRKLESARAAGHSRNIAALEAVQPEDVLPGDIDANLGAPWLPIDIISEFTADLLGVEGRAITVAHLPKDAAWSVEGDASAKASVANISEFGTSRMDGLSLIDSSLNLKTPTVYDEYKEDGTTKRTLNQTETFAAREKQQRIKQRFSGWIFSDPDRAERLVRLYNDTFNNLRLQQFDGSHLTFPGMTQAITLNPHQKAAVWRIVSDGNTLLAHVVGSGKTYIMATAAMKLKQAGIVRKSLIATPNHMLEQVGREFLHLYPNARLLIAGKEDLSKDRRRLLTAKIATGDWDAIIVTHSSFERIGMSVGFQQRFIREQIAEYEALLVEANQEKDKSRAHRNMIKTIEKRKAAFELKLEELMAEKKKDDGLVFDDLGVDQIFCDEFHHFKNLAASTKMDRVAGIQTDGSQKAFDVFMKARYLDEQHPGRGLVGATGTPISNTMVEMYTMQRYLSPALLEERGIAHFDAWAASFGEVVHTMEISPDGSSLRPNARFGKFVNLPELQQMFRSIADVQTADMLKLPTPTLKGGKAAVVSCLMTDDQRAIQMKLVERYEKIKRGGVDPRTDNALAITTDGRKLALDARLIDPTAPASEDSKIFQMLERAEEIWRRTTPVKGTQMIFCDIGVNPTAWGFCVYDEIKAGLRERGIPPEQIADIGDANTDAKKAALFERMRTGQVRFMIGSTAKMGTGTNVQTRLFAMHHMDAPWKPAEIEQRDGRILRQGNRNKEVEIYRYVTEGSFDAYMWQALQNKARFIAQIMKGDVGVRRASDIGGQELSFAEVKAIASGNPAVLTLAEIDADLQRLTLLKRSHADDQYRSRQQLKYLPEEIERLTAKASRLEAEYAKVTPITEKARERAVERFNATLKVIMASAYGAHDLGAYRGLELIIETSKDEEPEIVGGTHRLAFRNPAAGSLLNRLDHAIERLPDEVQRERERARLKAVQIEGYRGRVGQMFDQDGKLERLQEIRADLEGLLSGTGDRSRIDILVAEYGSLKEEPPKPRPQAELPVIVDIAPVRESAVERAKDRLVEAWERPSPQIIAIPKRTVARPVQLSLF
jgi:N12 class adenine-specific DNA methylase